jgi:2-polyprenyl-3-methyl-5-hydroxy-6-metoxy-1,4-benzoquinol methylase
VACDCASVGLDEIFTDRQARRDARRFLHRGPDRRAQRLLLAIEAVQPLKDARTLEIGAGVGGLSIELARRGAASALAIDAMPPSVAEAKRLIDRCGVGEQVRVLEGDFTVLADRIADADIVILDRVVCCYPEGPALLEIAASHARSLVALSYPRRVWWTGAFFGAVNTGQRLLRRQFRLFLHPPAELHRRLRAQGFTPRVVGRYWPWELVVAARN